MPLRHAGFISIVVIGIVCACVRSRHPITLSGDELFARSTYAKAAGLGALILCVPLALLILFLWLASIPKTGLALRMPGGDGRPASLQSEDGPVDFKGTFQQFDGAPSGLPGAWPRFRGASFDNIAADAPALAESWGEGGPPVLWTVPLLGEGYAGPAVLNGQVYVLDHDEAARSDTLRCFSLDDGRELWRHAYRVEVRRNHGMSRTTPAVTDTHVVSIGPRCHVLCLDAKTGALQWGIDLQQEHGTTEPLWYTGQCPLVEDGRVILAPGGPEALLMAVDLATGAVLWTTPNPAGWQMSHSSIMPMTLAGKRMYVYAAVGGLVGVSAEASDAGTLLWQAPWDAKVVAPSPVAIGEDRILALAGYGAGGIVVQVTKTDDDFEGKVMSRHSPRDGIAAEQHTPILYNGHLYTIMPKDASDLREQFVCYRTDGTLVWSSGKDHRFGLGPWLLADGKFFTLDDDGGLYIVRATPERFELLGEAQVLQGHESWAPMALAHDRLLLRDMSTLACVYVGIP
ncbi:MAG: PQQ-binding-like beta-propeller repeat protein [Candidatus Hydrogenedentes bacterium]|nr:PQQ-binding-like beta-propeller repeat protein [Candidatus Hydrogenedentota bacterium]